MIKLYIYDLKTKVFLQEEVGISKDIFDNMPEFLGFTMIAPPDYDHVWRWEDTKWVELLPINNPNIYYGDEYIWDNSQNQWVICPELDAYKYLDEQKEVWENIKKLRYQKMVGGVFVPSLNKWVHTDEAASTQYAFIGLRIMQGTYTPITWKAMDNTFIQLTKEVFIELQECMMEQTQTIHAKAEYHKLMMEASENPLEYDYTTNWE